jgi:hypothetical protein
MLLFGQPTVHSVIRSRRKHGDRHLIKTVQLAAVLSIIAACNRAADAAAPTVTIQTATSPDDLFPGGRVVYPEQNDSVLVAKFGPIEIGATGDFLIPDLSEGNVKHYARDGHLIRVIGRKGKGPGEFMTPFFARFLRDDSLLVADLAYHPTLSVFSPDGVFVSSFVLQEVATLQGLHVLANGNLLLTADSNDRDDEHALFEVNRQGHIMRELLPIRNVRPTGSERDPSNNWTTFRTSFLAVGADSAYVVNTLSDSLWTVSLATGEYKRLRLEVAGLHLPTAFPEERLRSWKSMFEFPNQVHLTSSIAWWRSSLVITFARGDLASEDAFTVVRWPDGTWSGARGKPRFVAARGGILAGIRNIGDSLRIDFIDTRKE